MKIINTMTTNTLITQLNATTTSNIDTRHFCVGDVVIVKKTIHLFKDKNCVGVYDIIEPGINFLIVDVSANLKVNVLSLPSLYKLTILFKEQLFFALIARYNCNFYLETISRI